MNLDELTEEILSCSSHDAEKQLSKILIEWKSTNETVSFLAKTVEDFIYTLQDGSTPISNEIKENWKRFKTEAIDRIDGFTMNERLYCFGLFDRYDNGKNQSDKQELYDKLHATL